MLALSLMTLNAHAQYYDYDVNKDGEVNVTDVTFLVNKILGQENPAPWRPLTFTVSKKPLVNADGQASVRRKTPETTIENLKKFYVNCTYLSNELDCYVYSIPEMETTKQIVEGGHGYWVIGNSQSSGNGGWPSDVSLTGNVKFYAYANVDGSQMDPYANYNVMFSCEGYEYNEDLEPIEGKDDVSKPYIHFNMDEGSGTTKDLLVAKQTDYFKHYPDVTDPRNGHVNFQFDHACAAAKFFLVKTTKLNNVTVNVTNVSLHNVKNDGYYYFEPDQDYNSGHWKNVTFRKVENKPGFYTLWDGKNSISVPEDNDNTRYSWQLIYSSTEDDTDSTEDDTDSTEGDTGSTEGDTGSTEDDFFFLIPYQYTESDNAYIDIVCTITPNSGAPADSKYFSGTARIPFCTRALQMGTWYPIVIQMGTSLKNKSGYNIFDATGKILIEN